MILDTLKEALPPSAKDIKLNLSAIFTEEGAPDLKLNQIYGIALASAYTTKQTEVIQDVLSLARDVLSENELEAAKSAAIIMAMNNVYYRFVHLISDKGYESMPAKLRMNVIGNPGIDKMDFEMMCLAVSALNACGKCIDAHAHELTKAGVSKLAIQSAVRIASVINAAAMGMVCA